jgi:hypothetical protein
MRPRVSCANVENVVHAPERAPREESIGAPFDSYIDAVAREGPE